jgi:hypothetical protein
VVVVARVWLRAEIDRQHSRQQAEDATVHPLQALVGILYGHERTRHS